MANRLQKAMTATPAWQDNFKAASLRVGFAMSLTRPMIEFLSAVADGVYWDRSTFGGSAAYPDNWIAVAAALFKRGLIERKPEPAGSPVGGQLHEERCWALSPAGRHAVELLKLTGVFVEADAAIGARSRGKACR